MSALIQEIDRAIERGWANGGHLAVIRELAAVAAPQPQAEPDTEAVARAILDALGGNPRVGIIPVAYVRAALKAIKAMQGALAPPRQQASAEDVAKWAQRLDDGYDSAESPAYVEFYRKDVVESVIREMRASLGVGRE